MRERGFSLLEVMVATLIMAVAVVALLSNLSTSLRNAARLTNYDRAAMLAKSKMDELLLVPRFPPGAVIDGQFDLSQTSGVPAAWRARATLFEAAPGAGPGMPALERIELEVRFEQGGQTKTFQLEGYRKRNLFPGEAMALP
ncbi:MAG: prepilin-type N-terminal cleavage/methylation domain-containing protein [Acidobacteria bacterium]|nr:prepilin-type N-terminal cleavage/methylation domain-containing protein [Acidobacteriota bacterium]